MPPRGYLNDIRNDTHGFLQDKYSQRKIIAIEGKCRRTMHIIIQLVLNLALDIRGLSESGSL